MINTSLNGSISAQMNIHSEYFSFKVSSLGFRTHTQLIYCKIFIGSASSNTQILISLRIFILNLMLPFLP